MPNHCIYNVALNMRQLWLKYLIQHSFAESNYELKSLLWFHLQLSTLCTQVYEKEVLDYAQKTASEECWIWGFLKASLHDRGLLEFLEGHISKDCWHI